MDNNDGTALARSLITSVPSVERLALSIVIPVYRSADCLKALKAAISEALVPLGIRYEVILVNDCSPDECWTVIEHLCRQDTNVIGVDLRRNFGQDNAILIGLVFLVLSVQQKGSARHLFSTFAGIAVAAALLSTPRSLPFCMGLVVGGVGLLYVGGLRCGLQVLLPAATITITAISVWTHSKGLSPWGWLRLISRSSVGDSGNVSPVLGGQWGVKIFLPTIATIALLLLVACFLGWLWVREHTLERTVTLLPESAFGLITALVNTTLTIVLLSRALDYQIFFVVPLICGLLVVSAELLTQTNQVALGRLVLSAWILFAFLGLGVRTVKLADIYSHWSSRNPGPLHIFIKENIPPGSLVLGVDPVYFWAVQEANARYIWIKEVTSPGLSSGMSFDAKSIPRHSSRSQAFLLWTDGEPLPTALSSLVGDRTVAVWTRNSRADFMSAFRPKSMRANYPSAHLYNISLFSAQNQ